MRISRTDREDLEVLDLLMVAQGEHKRLGVTLAVSQQEQPGGGGEGNSHFKTSAEEKPELLLLLSFFSPVHLALLDDHLMSLLSHDPTVEPDLGPVDHWKT